MNMDFFESTPFILAFTLIIYGVALKLYNRTKFFLFTPILVTVALSIVLLKLTGISYETYSEKASVIRFWLEPSVVALAIPLYLNMDKVLKHWKALVLSIFVGSISGIVSVVFIADAFGAPMEVVRSLAPKSVTTPIAIQITESVGGVVGITAGVVALVGILGAVIGEWVLKSINIVGAKSVGVAIGSAAHGLGVAKISERGEEYSAFGAVSIALNGIFTAIFTPILLPVMERIMATY